MKTQSVWYPADAPPLGVVLSVDLSTPMYDTPPETPSQVLAPMTVCIIWAVLS